MPLDTISNFYQTNFGFGFGSKLNKNEIFTVGPFILKIRRGLGKFEIVYGRSELDDKKSDSFKIEDGNFVWVLERKVKGDVVKGVDFIQQKIEQIRQQQAIEQIQQEKLVKDRRIKENNWPILRDEVRERLKTSVERINSQAVNALHLEDSGASIFLSFKSKKVRVEFDEKLLSLNVAFKYGPVKFGLTIDDNDCVSFQQPGTFESKNPEEVAQLIIDSVVVG